MKSIFEKLDKLTVEGHSRRSTLIAAGVLFALTLGMFGDVLLLPGQRTLSAQKNDIFAYFVPALTFGFREIAQGNLPLWNPHVFSGMPFLGTFQSAVLYPVNWLALVLPMAKTVNVSFALHTFLMGMFSYLWMASARVRPAAAVFGAVLAMFSGSFFLHLQAGHMTLFAAAAWIPLIFFAIDRYVETVRWPWLLLGCFALTMQILAGYPPAVFCTAIAALPYVLLRLIHHKPKLSIVAGLAVMGAGALSLSAIQIGAGLHTASESLRAKGLSYDFASSFSLPPESFFTLFAPRLFGDDLRIDYWGRWLYWEAVVYVGVVGITLALLGAITGKSPRRWPVIVSIVFLLVLALGKYTPVFRFAFEDLPGFASFRSPAKFVIQGSIMLCFLSALGVESLLRRDRAPKWLVVTAAVLALVLLAGGLAVQFLPPTSTLWRTATDNELGVFFGLVAVQFLEQSFYYLAPAHYAEILHDPFSIRFVDRATTFSAVQLYLAAGVAAAFALVVAFYGRNRRLGMLVVVLGAAELFVFARGSRPTFDLDNIWLPEVEAYFESTPGDYRVLDVDQRNHPMLVDALNMWGYDPVMLGRYAEFLAYTQTLPRSPKPDPYRDQDVTFVQYHNLFRLVRCSTLVAHTERRAWIMERPRAKESLPRIYFAGDWVVEPDPKRVFAAIDAPAFDFRETAVVDRAPPIEKATDGTVKRSVAIRDESTDHITIEAELEAPGVLVMTDVYSTGWRAYPVEPGAQDAYEVVPVFHFLRGVPLSAGKHVFRMEYAPLPYRIGRWITAGSLVVYIGLVGLWLYGLRAKRSHDAGHG